jgi:CBS domain-containing protein
MLGGSYRAVPVVEGGKPIGIITNTDLVRRGGLDARLELFASLGEPERRASLERLQSAGRVAGDVMTPRPISVEASTPLRRIAALMAQRRLKRLPVVDEHGALVGMVSRVDLLRTAAGGGAGAEPLAPDIGLDATGPVSRVMRSDAPAVRSDTELPVVVQAVMTTRLNRAVVLDAEGRVMGLVTDAELLDRLTPSLRPGALRSLMHRLPFTHPSAEEREAEHHARAKTAKDLMVRDVAAVTEDTPMSVAIEVMLRGNQKVLAIINTEGRMVGIVDRADLLHGLVSTPGGE